MPVVKSCLICGKEFETVCRKIREKKYCSHECYSESLKVDRTKECIYCGKTFTPNATRIKFCARECAIKERAKQRVVNCTVCGKEFKRSSIKHTHCSHECYTSQNTGENNPSYKGYMAKDEKGYVRFSNCHPEHSYKRKHQVVYDQSGKPRICEECGEPGPVIHHIDENKKNNDIDNLQCLCRSCHGKKHGRKKKVAK